MIAAASTLLGRFDRQIGRWTAGFSADRLASLLLLAFVLVWTLYAMLSRGSKDVHFDVGELVGWWREPSLRYHPPMSTWMAGLWFELFPRADWAAYLLGMTNVAIGLGIAWRLFRMRLDENKSLLGLAMLCLIPLYTFHGMRFNANSVLIPFWAATLYFFLKSFLTRSPFHAALAGAAGAGALLGKYWSLFLLAGLALAALMDRRRRAYWTSPAPWITLAVGLALVAPHLVSLFWGSTTTLGYAAAVRQPWSFESTVANSLEYLGGAIAYVGGPLIVLFALRPAKTALKDVFRPADPDGRLIAWMFWLPLLLPAALNLVLPTRLTSLWTIPNWLLLPVLLLQSPRISVSRAAAIRGLAAAVLFSLLMVLVAPVVALIFHQTGSSKEHGYFRRLAGAIETEWQAATDRPLRFIGGEPRLARGVALYLPSGAANTGLPFGAADPLPDGIALVCETTDPACLDRIAPAAGGRRSEITLTRSYWGIPQSQDFAIVVIPPR